MFSWLCNFDEKSYNIAVIFFVKSFVFNETLS